MIGKQESGVSSEKNDNKNEERYTAHSDGNKIFKKEDEKEKEKAGTSSPEKKNIFNSVDASKNNQKINKEIIGDKINTKSEKEFDAKEIISRLREENVQIKKENEQIKKENAKLKHDLEELQVKFDTLMKVHQVMLSRLDGVEKHNELLQKKADKFDIFLELYPQLMEMFGVDIEPHVTGAKEDEKKEENSKQSDADKKEKKDKNKREEKKSNK